MKVLLVCMIFLLGTVSAHDWESWKGKHKKIYSSSEEESYRKGIFQFHSDLINRHNANSAKTFTMEVNHLSDMTPEEVKSAMMGAKIPKNRKFDSIFSGETVDRTALPASIDWRTSNAVNAIKDQGQCGSCWAFSAVAALEGQYAIKHKSLQSFSEQQIVDCSKSNGGCNGGFPAYAYQDLETMKELAETEASYPYINLANPSTTEACKYTSTKGVANITGIVAVQSGNETALQAAVATIGPMSICINAALGSFQSYSSGVYNDKCCTSDNIDHCVAVVGYGALNGTAYWIVRNSWGTGWGMSGYMLMARNANNMCGIASYGYYPTVA